MNEYHLKRLQEGVDSWNRWRKSEHVFPDLSEANLHAAVLQGINLSATNLFKTDLSQAQLVGANLQKSCVQFADLSGANFAFARMEQADMHFARARGAHWEGVDFTQIKGWSTIAGIPVAWPVEIMPGLLRAQVTCQVPGCSEIVLCLDLTRVGVFHPEMGPIERSPDEEEEIVAQLIYQFDDYHRHTYLCPWPMDDIYTGSFTAEQYTLAEQAFQQGDFVSPFEYLDSGDSSDEGVLPFYCRVCKKIYCVNHTSTALADFSDETAVYWHVFCPSGHIMKCLLD